MRQTRMRNRFTGETFLAPHPATLYGSSNRASDGEPMFEAVPEYRASNPKIDLTDAAGHYLASTNQFQTIREAVHYYSTRTIAGQTPTRGSIDRR